ncbi:MAG TPA: hypothetical protein VMP68_18460 [Candidatus Eisenbacteria bacterium]|nr:hypothetical protein [Candidatus Eisenbacteria bacterium]
MPSTSLPSAASSWTKATLDALNASFNRHMITEFVFDRTRLAIPIDWQQGNSQGAFHPQLLTGFA